MTQLSLPFTETPPQLSFSRDEPYVEELRWAVELSNGKTVFQDDARPNADPQSAWLRLKQYVEKNELGIEAFRLEFRSHHEVICHKSKGIYFCKGVYGILGEDRSYNMYVAGDLDDGFVHISKWLVPELIILDREARPVEQCEELLIRSHNG